MVQQHRIGSVGWFGAGLLVGVVGFLGWIIFGGTPYQLDQQGNVEAVVAVVEQFMNAGVQRDVPTAQRAVSSATTTLTSDVLTTLFQTRRDLFDMYQSITGKTYGVGLSTDWRGTQAQIGGSISYQNGTTRPFEAQLLKRNNRWQLVTITLDGGAVQGQTP